MFPQLSIELLLLIEFQENQMLRANIPLAGGTRPRAPLLFPFYWRFNEQVIAWQIFIVGFGESVQSIHDFMTIILWETHRENRLAVCAQQRWHEQQMGVRKSSINSTTINKEVVIGHFLACSATNTIIPNLFSPNSHKVCRIQFDLTLSQCRNWKVRKCSEITTS